MKKISIILLVVVIIAIGVAIWLVASKPSSNGQGGNATSTLISEVNYLCDNNRTINAKYYKGPEAPAPQPGEPPTPTGSVQLILSDGRQLTLDQTISGSGIRYANSDESLVFWSKGNGAFITEGDAQTYAGCIAIAKDPGNLPQVYENSALGFSIRYPAGYIVDPSYKYQDLGPGQEISGIKFIIPEEMATGTNLSSFDTGISVEFMPNQQECTARTFLYRVDGLAEITDNDVSYSVATSSGAAAGNFYEETVWALAGTSPCTAVRYFIHSANIGNYPEGAVQEFDRQALLGQFDAIRRTLILSN